MSTGVCRLSPRAVRLRRRRRPPSSEQRESGLRRHEASWSFGDPSAATFAQTKIGDGIQRFDGRFGHHRFDPDVFQRLGAHLGLFGAAPVVNHTGAQQSLKVLREAAVEPVLEPLDHGVTDAVLQPDRHTLPPQPLEPLDHDQARS